VKVGCTDTPDRFETSIAARGTSPIVPRLLNQSRIDSRPAMTDQQPANDNNYPSCRDQARPIIFGS
jgi:hypothetical protein